ncbi:hypothetical protein HPB50_024078 [Hyalomma asiaticum]|uniref:Uncharacterized protein n=1 Tax=Hyalomma asiaticum TaxID=266040 RepID=A0ACB7SQJ7_HYAAI|nr:hypothetical protein HPB50_024078 [Hyalomma asiaticum]
MPTMTEVCSHFTEWLWNQLRPALPARKRIPASSEAHVLKLIRDDVPLEHLKVFGKGLKFCMEPHLRPVKIFSMPRSVAPQVPENSRTASVK